MSQRRKQHAKKKKRAVRGSFLSERLEEANTDKKVLYRVTSVAFLTKTNPTLTYGVLYTKLFTSIECRVFERTIFHVTKIPPMKNFFYLLVN